MTDVKQPEALRLIAEWRDSMPIGVMRIWAADVRDELRRQHAEIESLRMRPQEASYTSVQLAEMILSDCGCSTNNTSLLERVAKRIDRHSDTLSQPAPAAVVGPTNKVLWLLMAQYGLNMTVGQDMDNLLNFGRDVWNAALSTTQPAPAAQDDASVQPSTCTWSLDDEDSSTWSSSCGELWSFISGGPDENRVTYCHHCGKPVDVARAADKKEPT